MMSGSDRTSLPIPEFDDEGLDDFAPRERAASVHPDTKRAVDAVSSFPSREASEDGQLNMKGRKTVLNRFKAMCKEDRRSYVDMLEILMDRFEKGRG